MAVTSVYLPNDKEARVQYLRDREAQPLLDVQRWVVAFIPGRLIGDNLSSIVDLLCYCEDAGLEGLAVANDLIKMYDMICPDFCGKTVEASMCTMVPWPESFASWVSLLHTGGLRAARINGMLSEWFALLSGLPQGSPLSCLLSCLVEQAKASMMAMTEEEFGAVQRKFGGVAELQQLQYIVKLAMPAGDAVAEYRYADDMYNFVARTAANLKALVALIEFCGLGSGASMNMLKTFVQLIGCGRQQPGWAEVCAAAGLQFVPDGEGMEVTGLVTGYGSQLRAAVWKGKIERAIRNLRSWMRVTLTRGDRALVFRAYAMSLWAFTAAPVPPTPQQVKVMASIRRRFVLTGRLPKEGKAVTTRSKVSSSEIARAVADGGQALPTIREWVDDLNCSQVLRLLDAYELTRQWSHYPVWWAAAAIGVWGEQPQGAAV